MNLSGKNIIGYSLSGNPENCFQAVNPVDGSLSESNYCIASSHDIDSAMNLAGKAAADLSKLSPEQKALFLERIANNILLTGDLLIKTCQFETGFPESRVISERGRTVSQIRMFAEFIREGSWVEATIDTALHDRQPVAKPDIRKMLFPIGPVVVFGAGNFPLAFSVAGGDTISALAAGNPVIVKAHPAHPGTSDLVGQCILNAAQDSGMPEGTFSLLFDSGFSVGKSLVTHPLTRAVAFTGSYHGGKSLFDLAMNRPEPIPVFAEMGSVNPIFILPSAMHEKASQIAQKIAASVTLSAGQFCTNPGIIIIPDNEDKHHFLDSLAEAIHSALPQTMLTSSIADRYQSDIKELLESKKINLLSRSVHPTAKNQAPPTVAIVTAEIFELNPNLADEIFGPYSLVVLYQSNEQMSRIAKNLRGQLTISIFHDDAGELGSCSDFVDLARTRAGRIVFNGVPTGVEVCPSMHHGGPFPASTDSRFTSVGTSAIKRWAMPVAFQDCPADLLPPAIQPGNPLGIWRSVNGKTTRD